MEVLLKQKEGAGILLNICCANWGQKQENLVFFLYSDFGTLTNPIFHKNCVKWYHLGPNQMNKFYYKENSKVFSSILGAHNGIFFIKFCIFFKIVASSLLQLFHHCKLGERHLGQHYWYKMGDRLLNENLLYKSGIKMGNIILLEYFNVDRMVTIFFFKPSVSNGANYALSI